MTASEYRDNVERTLPQSALVGDNKGLYTSVESANPITTKGERRLTIDKVIMKDHLRDHHVKYYWTNAGHQLADGFTKLSTGGARSDLLIDALERGVIRITYCEVSDRKEQKAAKAEPQMFSMSRSRPSKRAKIEPLDAWDEWFYDLS
jgi:hypothetical protein